MVHHPNTLLHTLPKFLCWLLWPLLTMMVSVKTFLSSAGPSLPHSRWLWKCEKLRRPPQLRSSDFWRAYNGWKKEKEKIKQKLLKEGRWLRFILSVSQGSLFWNRCGLLFWKSWERLVRPGQSLIDACFCQVCEDERHRWILIHLPFWVCFAST